MYNLFVSENGEAYHGGPWQNEQSRCVREYTSDAIQERFGSFDDDADFDDDTAWKVRKTTVKVIEALFASCPAIVRPSWILYIQMLSNRFTERVNHVKVDVLKTF